MVNPLFIQQKYHSPQRKREFSHKDKSIPASAAINNSIYPFFKNGVGNIVAKVAFERKDYPAHINGHAMCLYYHLQGKYFKGESYPHAASHYYLDGKKFRHIIN